MEFWEGAILVVGGIWLVGRMSRQTAAHPLNATAVTDLVTPSNVPNLTNITNTAGEPVVVWGEPLDPAPVPVLKPGGPLYVVPTGTQPQPVARPVPSGASTTTPVSGSKVSTRAPVVGRAMPVPVRTARYLV